MPQFYTIIVKTFFDYLMSFLLLLIFSPFLLLLITVLFFFNKRQIFFLQKRPGLKGKPFTIIKFKTMLDIYNNDGELLPDEERQTYFGQIIRKSSFDEILQLINVLKGEMSIIGPRPLLMEYLLLYNSEQIKRHNVKPGITGWAQVNGRNAISWDEKFNFDIYYVNNISFKLDLIILYNTFINVITRKNINFNNSITMEKFKGNNS